MIPYLVGLVVFFNSPFISAQNLNGIPKKVHVLTRQNIAPLVFKLRVFVQDLNQRSLRKVDDERNRFENQVDYFLSP